MKLRTVKEIDQILVNKWPHLDPQKQVWPFDKQFPCLTHDEYIHHINKAKVETIGDCDDRAIFMMADVRRSFFRESPSFIAVAFGFVFGTIFNAWPAEHAQCIAITDMGTILLIEPQTREVWEASSTDDHPLWTFF